MKEISENIFRLTDKEIAVIHAIAYYFTQINAEDDTLTGEAEKIVNEIEKKFRLDERIESLRVWAK